VSWTLTRTKLWCYLLTFRPFKGSPSIIYSFIRTQPNDIYTDIERGFRHIFEAKIYAQLFDQKLQNKNILNFWNKYQIILRVGCRRCNKCLIVLNTYKIFEKNKNEPNFFIDRQIYKNVGQTKIRSKSLSRPIIPLTSFLKWRGPKNHRLESH
jgi:hypothetical protein